MSHPPGVQQGYELRRKREVFCVMVCGTKNRYDDIAEVLRNICGPA